MRCIREEVIPSLAERSPKAVRCYNLDRPAAVGAHPTCGMFMTFADYEGSASVDGPLKLRDGTVRFGGGSRSARQAGTIVLMALRSCGNQAQLVGADAGVWRVNGTHD